MIRRIAAIVEGKGEVRAVPVMLKRIARAVAPDQSVSVDPNPWYIPRGRLLRDDAEVVKALDTLAVGIKGRGGILVLFDSDDDCPATLAPEQARRIRNLRRDLSIAVVMAHREYEAWFLAAAASCAGTAGLHEALADQSHAEATRDCKRWLTAHMPRGAPYKETLHQALLSEALDIDRARRNSPSFDKLCREVARLIGD